MKSLPEIDTYNDTFRPYCISPFKDKGRVLYGTRGCPSGKGGGFKHRWRQSHGFESHSTHFETIRWVFSKIDAVEV